eukprot:scaffold268197_cov17-Tisochrysis_lutea.AAC.1
MSDPFHTIVVKECRPFSVIPYPVKKAQCFQEGVLSACVRRSIELRFSLQMTALTDEFFLDASWYSSRKYF